MSLTDLQPAPHGSRSDPSSAAERPTARIVELDLEAASAPALDADADAPLTTYIVSDTAELAALEPAWRALESHPNHLFDVFRERVRRDPEVLAPCVIVVARAGRPRLIALGLILNHEEIFRFGYWRLFKRHERVLAILEHGILGVSRRDNPGDRAEAEALVEGIMSVLRSRRAGMAHLACQPLESAVHDAALRLPPSLLRDHFSQPDVRRIVELPKNGEDFLRGLRRHTRAKLQRSARAFEQAFAGRVRVEHYEDAASIQRGFADVETVARTTYQRGMGVGFSLDAATRWSLDASAARGQLALDVMYIDDRPAAFCYGRIFKEWYVYETPGYDPQYAEHRIGHYLLLARLRRLAAHPTVRRVDFGFGDAAYKQSYAASASVERHVRIFAPGLAGMRMHLFFALGEGLQDSTIAALRRLRLYDTIKRWSRRRLSRRA